MTLTVAGTPAVSSGAHRSELRAMVGLAAPVVIVQVGMMAMGVIDTLMVGRISARTLAAVALGNLYFLSVITPFVGTLMALDPIVAQAIGAGDEPAVGRAMQRGLLLAFALSIVAAALLFPSSAALRLFRQPAEIVPDAASYIRVSIIGVLPFLSFIVLRQSLQAIGRMAPIVWTIVAANAMNAILNWVFVYGHLGSRPLGAVGSAIATCISRWLMAFLLLGGAWSELRPHLLPLRRAALEPAPLMRLLSLGVPIGLQQALEVGAFGAIGLLMGVLGTAEMAAHQIAITLAALTFMVPLGVSGAAAVRVGRAIGAEDPALAKRAAHAALLCGMGFMSVTALIFLGAPGPLARAFTADPRVLAIARVLLPIAGVFQIFDGTQAVGAGVLRGIGDTRAPLVAMLAGYWLIGIPISAYLGFRTDLRAAGLWWGFVASLGCVALFLLLRMHHLFARGVRRIVLDEPALVD